MLPYVCPGCGRNTRGPDHHLGPNPQYPAGPNCYDCGTPRIRHLRLDGYPELEAVIRLGDRHAVLAFLAEWRKR